MAGWGLGRLRVCHIVGLGREGIGGKAGGAGLVGSELVCAWKNRNTDGNFPVKYGNRRYGQESPLTASAPVPAVFSRVFFLFPVFFINTVYDQFIRDSVPVGTGFSRPVFNPSQDWQNYELTKRS